MSADDSTMTRPDRFELSDEQLETILSFVGGASGVEVTDELRPKLERLARVASLSPPLYSTLWHLNRVLATQYRRLMMAAIKEVLTPKGFWRGMRLAALRIAGTAVETTQRFVGEAATMTLEADARGKPDEMVEIIERWTGREFKCADPNCPVHGKTENEAYEPAPAPDADPDRVEPLTVGEVDRLWHEAFPHLE